MEKIISINIFFFFLILRSLLETSSCLITQTAEYRKTRFNHRKLFWVNRRGGGFDENITKENQEFLNQVLIDKYSIKESPLKDGPWKKGEFEINGM